MIKRAPLVIAIIVICFIVYFQSFFNGFVWDDESLFVYNPLVHTAANIPQFFKGDIFDPRGRGEAVYYKPLLPTFLSVLYTFFGTNPFPSHVFQVALHIVNALLVFFLFSRFFQRIVAFILAILFAIHPIQVEAVVYISALQDVLFFFFGMIALYLLWRRTHVLLVALFLVLALLSKETGVLFLVAVLLFTLAFARNTVGKQILTIAISLSGYLLLRLHIAGVPFQAADYLPISRASLFERILTMPKIFSYYLQSFFFPRDLAISQHWVVRKMTFFDFYFPLLIVFAFLAAMSILGVRVWRTNNKQRFVFLFFCFWFFLGIGFHLQIFPLSMTVADRWFYFPMVGLLGLIGIIVQSLYDYARSDIPRGKKTLSQFPIVGLLGMIAPPASFFDRIRLRVLALGAVLLIIGILSARTVWRSLDWRDALTLYSKDITISKGSFDLENALGVELFKRGSFTQAKIHFERSVSLLALPINLTNMGLFYQEIGESGKAREYYEKALEQRSSYLTYEAIANMLLLHESPTSATAFAKEAVRLFPQSPKLWMTIALAEYKLGNMNEAKVAGEKALSFMTKEEYARFMHELNL